MTDPAAEMELAAVADEEFDGCPNDWKVRGYVRSSHSMFHPAMHECVRERDHAGRCRCFCGSTHEKERNPYDRWFAR